MRIEDVYGGGRMRVEEAYVICKYIVQRVRQSESFTLIEKTLHLIVCCIRCMPDKKRCKIS